MKLTFVVTLLFSVLAIVFAKTYFKETFNDGWQKRWIESDWKTDSSRGKFDLSAGKYYNDAEKDKGLHLTEDYRYYTISAEFPEFSNKGKSLVLQYSVKTEQRLDCGGAYLKLLPKGLNQKEFNGDSPYNIMFGPDVCGTTTKKVHVIFNHDDKNHLVKKDIPCETDEFTHLYTLIVKPDNTYKVKIDGVEKAQGSLEEDWDMLPPKEINDPNAKKPSDWVDDKEMDDPADKKPEGWDDIPAEIKDPNAQKPDDWDDELDGEWEAPTIPNPEYKGEWKAKRIPNPAYKGEWIHPKIANPEYKPNPELYVDDSFKYVGLEVWQVKSGSIFDNIIITDSEDEAETFAKETLEKTKKGEKAMHEVQQEEEKKKQEEERKQREEEEKKKKAEGGDKKDDTKGDDDEDDDDDDDDDEEEGHHGHDHHGHSHGHDHHGHKEEKDEL